MKKKFLLHILFIIIAFVIVWITTASQKVEVFNKDDLRTLSCGWPFEFATNDQSSKDPPFPWKISCLGGEWGSPIKIHWPQLVVDVLVFYALIVFIWIAYVALNNKIRR